MTDYNDPRQFDDPRKFPDPRLPQAWDDPFDYDRYYDGGILPPLPGYYPEDAPNREAYQRELFARTHQLFEANDQQPYDRYSGRGQEPEKPMSEEEIKESAGRLLRGVLDDMYDIADFTDSMYLSRNSRKIYRLVRVGYEYGELAAYMNDHKIGPEALVGDKQRIVTEARSVFDFDTQLDSRRKYRRLVQEAKARGKYTEPDYMLPKTSAYKPPVAVSPNRAQSPKNEPVDPNAQRQGHFQEKRVTFRRWLERMLAEL